MSLLPSSSVSSTKTLSLLCCASLISVYHNIFSKCYPTWLHFCGTIYFMSYHHYIQEYQRDNCGGGVIIDCD
jgi:hypothetical protein